MQEGENPRERISHGEPDSLHCSTLVVFAVASVGNYHSVLRHLALFGSEEIRSGVMREIGDAPESDNSDGDAHDT